MAIDKNSTGYTFLFSIAMVVVVGTALAFTALSLKDRQDANAADKKMMDILGAIGVSADRTNANTLFAEYVVERVAIDLDGRQVSATSTAVDPKDKADPFSINVKKDYRASIKSAARELLAGRIVFRWKIAHHRRASAVHERNARAASEFGFRTSSSRSPEPSLLT